MMIAGFFIIRLLLNNKQRPEAQPFWGKKVREKMTKEVLDNRSKTWGKESKYELVNGLNKVGKIKTFELISQNAFERKREAYGTQGKTKMVTKPSEDLIQFYSIAFVPKGFMAMIKGWLGKYEHFICDPKVITISHKDKAINISPAAFIVEDSGVWIVGTNKESKFINDLNLMAEINNIKGFTTDYLRRLSEQAPTQSMVTQRMATQAQLEEEAKQNRVSSWVGGKK